MRNVIVTGGSRGLGLGIVQRLAETGFRAIAIARNPTEAFATAKKEAVEGALEFVPFDLSLIDDIPALVTRLRREFGPIYGLVNNAALSADGTLALMKIHEIESAFRLNTISPLVLTKYVVRAMMADGGGRIVNISSVVAATGYR